ncbi:MAG: hypothetical protein ABR880_10155 [Candidatus Sulfotelmatobacter sp.]|jgi:hypothetical protein
MRMIKVRFWIEMLALVSVMACALALFLATLGAAAGVASAGPESGPPPHASTGAPQSYEGIITDTHCGAKHSAAVGMAAADCTRVCVRSGESFALVDGDKAYTLAGEPAALKRVAGQRVKIVGTLNGDTISVAAVGAS